MSLTNIAKYIEAPQVLKLFNLVTWSQEAFCNTIMIYFMFYFGLQNLEEKL